MSYLVVRAYLALLRFEIFLACKNFAGLYDTVRQRPSRRGAHDTDTIGTIGKITSAVDLACIWYWKHVFCLQRSAVTVCLLRDRGVPAQLVIGARQMPFEAHAWVEVDGQVVNDKSYTNEVYAVLDRC
jgi:hypothetical protein